MIKTKHKQQIQAEPCRDPAAVLYADRDRMGSALYFGVSW